MSALMETHRVVEVLPQKGRARAIDEVLWFDDGRQLATVDLFRPYWAEQIGNIEKPNDGPFEDQVFQLGLTAEMLEFAGHFPDRPIMPGHFGLDFAMKFANDLAGATYSATKIKANFMQPVFPGCYHLEIAGLISTRSSIAFTAKIYCDSCDCCDFEIHARRIKEGGTIRPNFLIEAAAQAATLHSYHREGSLENPVIFRSVEAEFYHHAPCASSLFLLTHNDRGRKGAVACNVDITNHDRQIVGRLQINGAPVPFDKLFS